jgi:protein-disulfide isomerase
MKMRHFLIGAAIGLALWSLPSAALAQFAGTGPRDNFRDTTILRPPAGSKVALIVFEDLGCPACARAHPYELQAIQQTHVPLLRYDFPLEAHIWTFQGAVYARYIQDKIGPALAGEFRSAVFLAQSSISNKDDLQQFTSAWLRKHGRQMPATVDPNGTLAKEVTADLDLGKRLNVEWTPTVVVVTRNQYQVVCGTSNGTNDPTQILPVIQGALAQAK